MIDISKEFKDALKEIGGLTIQRDTVNICLEPETLFRLWQAALCIRNNALVEALESIILYTVPDSDRPKSPIIMANNLIIIRRLAQKCQALLHSQGGGKDEL